MNFGYQEQICGCYRLRRDSGPCLQLYCSDVEHGYIPRLPSLALEKQGKPRVLDGSHVEELLICGGIFLPNSRMIFLCWEELLTFHAMVNWVILELLLMSYTELLLFQKVF